MEVKSFIYKDIPYEYSIRKNARAKRVSISVSREGKVLVTKPVRVPLYMVNAFMESQAEWIIARIAVVARHAMNTPKVPSYKESKELARTIITNRVMHFAPLYGKEIKKITIRNQKTRWGSCSSNGTLSFNYHLLFVTPELRDYVVVHEICHIMAPNHSPKFWKLVAEKMPNYKMLRAELKNHAFNYE